VDSNAAHAIAARIPHAVVAGSADHQRMLEDDLLITRARDFLAAPVEVARP